MTKNRTLRLPDDLDEALRVEAAHKGIPVHALILEKLEESLPGSMERPGPIMITFPPDPPPADDPPSISGPGMQVSRYGPTTINFPPGPHQPDTTEPPHSPPLDAEGIPPDCPAREA